MPSLRQKVTTYFRQLSFIAEPREHHGTPATQNQRKPVDGNFITKYLEGDLENNACPQPEIHHSRDPNDLPDYKIDSYPTGVNTITAAFTGPDEGITSIKRLTPHLSLGTNIDYIDTAQEQDNETRPSINTQKNKYMQRNRLEQKCTRIRKPSRDNDNLNIKQFNEIMNTNILNQNENIKQDITDNISNTHNPNNSNEMQENYNESVLIQEKLTSSTSNANINEPIAGIENWKMDNEHAYGCSTSLYEKSHITKEHMGNPIADCFGLIVRSNCAVLALADGVNWGEGARLAARCSVLGSLEYLNTAIFGASLNTTTITTRDIFVSLLRSFWKAHDCILELGGALSTLTIAIVLPLSETNSGKYVVCSCNVGDSFGYVYSKTHGVRELTQGSHDITLMRDMRDALGALGPVDGNKPELSNLTLSLTTVEPGDIVFLTSDGISDNFDPVVGKFAEAIGVDKKNKTEIQLAPKRQNKSATTLNTILNNGINFESTAKTKRSTYNLTTQRTTPKMKSNIENLPQTTNMRNNSQRPKFMRSHTVIESRISKNTTRTPNNLLKSPSGLPLVTSQQRYKLTLLRLEDLLSYGINGTLRPCPSARKLCHLLIDFVKMITAARRKILEQNELFYKITTDPDGNKKKTQLTRAQHKVARKRIIDTMLFSSLPGKLDHASVVAFTVGSGLQATEFTETSF